VRRRFGTKFVQLREFDRFEAQSEKATPLVNRRRTLPTRPMGLYKSTELDTTERRIPWYIIALPILLVGSVGLAYYTFGGMGKRLTGGDSSALSVASGATAPRDGALATAGGAVARHSPTPIKDYVDQFIPRVPSQPWSAPVYADALTVPNEPPRLFCMSSLGGLNGLSEVDEPSCTCVTEQGTSYDLEESTCRYVARRGQYEPYLPRRENRFVNAETQMQRAIGELNEIEHQRGTAIARGNRAMGTFPESPSIQTDSYTRAGENRL